VWVVEDHDEVLQPIHRASATKVLAFEDITVVHFDAHPHLLV
jgi:hypothetical protein